jgi:hypothetical protein
MWTLAFGHHEDRTPTHGYAETREDAMAAFARAGDGGGSKRKPRGGRGFQGELTRTSRDLPSRVIRCSVCKEPLASTDGEYVLKYFLVDKAKKQNGVDLRMNHPPKRERGSRS